MGIILGKLGFANPSRFSSRRSKSLFRDEDGEEVAVDDVEASLL